MAQRPQTSLDRDRLVAAAFAELEAEGLEALSMRRLAARLGVQAPALYWHIGDKAELLGLMAGAIYASAYAAVPEVRDWRSWLRALGRALRTSFAAHRDGARLCAIAQPAAPARPTTQAERIAAPLVARGLSPQDALAFEAAVISFAIGWATFEANGPMRDFLTQMMDFEATFGRGLDALVAGLTETSPD